MKSPNRSPELQRSDADSRACVCWANNPTECLPQHSASTSQAMTKIGRPRIIESPAEMERLVEEYAHYPTSHDCESMTTNGKQQRRRETPHRP